MSDRRGFAAIEGLLVLVILAIVGFAGWYVHDSNNKINKSLDSSAQIKSASNASSSTATQKQDQVDQKQDEAQTEDTASSEVNAQSILGETFIFDKSLGTVLTWNRTSEGVNLSSASLLSQEKSLYGDNDLQCTANSYPLGTMTVKDSSMPPVDEGLVKHLSSGKYLFYGAPPKSTFCYQNRASLREIIDQQVVLIQNALKKSE